MAKGLENRNSFNTFLTATQKQVFGRLAEIEREDADRCASCGGEDCICCEYYHDRQKWVEPDEMLRNWEFDEGLRYYEEDEDDY